MREQIVKRLYGRFKAYGDLAEELSDELLSQKVDVPKHKSLADHLWCVVGARESYARALEQGTWVGFSCSMEAFGAVDFFKKLEESSSAMEAAIGLISDWTDERLSLLATLAEHEVMHEGQIIRHMYALEKNLPKSWVWA